MSDQPLISIITSAYTHEAYVGYLIESLMAQTYPRLEYIIIDDGSKDDTAQVIASYRTACEKRFERFEFISRENRGLIATMNELMPMTRGEFVYGIASDDAAEPQAISTLFEFMKANPDYVIAVGDAKFIDREHQRCYWGHRKSLVYDVAKARSKTHAEHLRRKRPDIDFLSEGFGSYKSLLSGNYIPNGWLIRKTVLDIVGGYNPDTRLDDWHYAMQIAKHGKIKFIDRILYSYRWHGENTVTQSEKMATCHDETLVVESEEAKRSGLAQYLPKEILLRFLGLKLFKFERRMGVSKVKLFGLTIYKNKISNYP